MATLSHRALIGSLQQHKLGITGLLSESWESNLSEMRDQVETIRESGEATDTKASRAVQLAWALAMQAQSCAYLALELQKCAETLSASQIMCQELTFKRLLGSAEIFARLLESMRGSYADFNRDESSNYIPVLSERLAEAIRYMLEVDQATSTAGFTTNTERASQKNTKDVGDTK